MLKSSAICPRLHFYCTYQPFEIWTNKLNVKFQVFVFPKVSRKWSISDNQEIIIGQMSISAQVRPSSRRGNLHNFYIFLCTEDWSITIKQRLAHTCFFIQALNSFSSVDCPVICRSSDKNVESLYPACQLITNLVNIYCFKKVVSKYLW